MAAAHSFSFVRRNASSFFHVLYASAAAATASSTCSFEPRGQVAKASPRAGLMTSSCPGVVPERPLIRIEYELIETPSVVECGGTRRGLAHPLCRDNRSAIASDEASDGAWRVL